MTPKWGRPGIILLRLRDALAILVAGLALVGAGCTGSCDEVDASNLIRPSQQIQLPLVCRNFELSDQKALAHLSDLCDYDNKTAWTLAETDAAEGEQWIRFDFHREIALDRVVVYPRQLSELSLNAPTTVHLQTFSQDELQFDSVVFYLDSIRTDDLKIEARRTPNALSSPLVSEIHLYGWDLGQEIPLALLADSVFASSHRSDSTRSRYESSELNILDGDWRTIWNPAETNDADSHWVHIVLSNEVQLSAVMLYGRFGTTLEPGLPDLRSREFSITLSDGSCHIVSLSANPGFCVVEIEPSVTSSIRIATSAQAVMDGQIGPALSEIQAHGSIVEPVPRLSQERAEQVRAAIASNEERLRTFSQQEIESFSRYWASDLAFYARGNGLLMTDDAGEGNLLSVQLLLASGKDGLNLLKEMLFYSQEYRGLQLSDVYTVLTKAISDETFHQISGQKELLIPVLWRAAHLGEKRRACAACALLHFNDTRAIASLVNQRLLEVIDDTLILFDDDCTCMTLEQVVLQHRDASTKYEIRRLLQDQNEMQEKMKRVFNRLLEVLD